MPDIQDDTPLETGSIPDIKVPEAEAISAIAHAATLAEWIYADLRIQTRDWSEILRNTVDTSLPKMALLDGAFGLTPPVLTDSVDHDGGRKAIAGGVSLAGLPGSPASLDHLFAGVQEARVQEARIFASAIDLRAVEPGFLPLQIPFAQGPFSDQPQTIASSTVSSLSVENTGAGTSVFTPVAAISPINAGPDVMFPSVIKAEPVVAPEPPVAPSQDPAEIFAFGLNSGRVYVADFDAGRDIIRIGSDLATSYADLLEGASFYQDETATVFEFSNATDLLILQHFSVKDLNEAMFSFDVPREDKKDQATQESVSGTERDDTLTFGEGDQTIDPGAGFDVVTGGNGRDLFVFGINSGHDFIVDFTPGEDHIQIGSDLAADFGELTDHASIYQDGGSTQIEFSSGQLITLYGVNAERVSADWFAFT
ncbi:MAG: hypothetical protein ACKVON_01050 [Beijerinckiaceae bacterium]